MTDLNLPPWVSYRSYKDENGIFAIIGNAKLHELIYIENFHVNIMNDVYDHGLNRGDILKKYAEQSTEAVKIIDEFLENEILINPLSKIDAPFEPPPSPFSDIDKSDEYVSLESHVSARIEKAGKLFSFFWEITYKCNEACIHCYNPGAAHKKGDKNKRKTDLISRDQIISLLEDLVEMGVFRITISGGEAFLHKDFFFILEEAKKRHFQVMIFTNGLLIDKNNVKRLKDLYPDDIGITLYTHNEYKHDEITRIKGSHQKSLRALSLLHKHGIRTHVKTPLMGKTASDFDQTKKLINKLGTRQTVDGYITAGNDNNLDPVKLNLSINQIAELAFSSGSPYYIDQSRNFGRRSRNPKSSVCNAGLSVMSMTPNGKVTPCPALPLEVGDITKEKLSDIWRERNHTKKWKPAIRPSSIDQGIRTIKIFDPNNPSISHERVANNRPGSLAEWRSIKLQNYVECGTHERCEWCNTKCPGAAMNETGDPLEKSRVQCKIAFTKMLVATGLEAGKSKKEILNNIRKNYS